MASFVNHLARVVKGSNASRRRLHRVGSVSRGKTDARANDRASFGTKQH